MAEPLLCIIWNDHANELATVCKSLLEKDFLVDCTVAAEGGSLKAHRLILSASSPYFQMLFSEEKEKYPIVILKDASFVTLKTVIDFVYNGKAEIPENQLEAFLDLAVSLQIKGLNNTFQKNRKTDVGGNADDNARQCASVMEDDCGVQSTRPSYEDNFSNSSHQHKYLLPNGCSDTADTVSSVSLERRSDSCEKVQSGAMEIPPQNHQSCSMHTDREEFIIPEICVKHEPLHSEIEILETKTEVVDAEQDEPMSKSLESEMNMSASTCENILEQYTCAEEPALAQEQVMLQQRCPQQSRASFIESSNLATHKPKHRAEQHTYSCDMCGKIFTHQSGLDFHKRTHTGESPYQCDVCGKVFAHQNSLDNHKLSHTGNRPYPCFCGKAFKRTRDFTWHMRTHMSERSYSCDVCGKSFNHASHLASHKRSHTRESSYQCDAVKSSVNIFGDIAL